METESRRTLINEGGNLSPMYFGLLIIQIKKRQFKVRKQRFHEVSYIRIDSIPL